MVANPASDILCRRINIQHFVDILMVKRAFYDALDMRKIRYHTVLIQFFGFAIDDDFPVVSMQILAFAFVAQFQIMSRGAGQCFFYVIHVLFVLGNALI